MASFVDLYTWTVSGKRTRKEDFLSGCLALTARHDQEFARALFGLLVQGAPVSPSSSVQVGYQEAALHDGESGGRTDLTFEADGHRLVVECKVGTNPLDAEVLERYRRCTRPPCTVVGLVEIREADLLEGFAVFTWAQIAVLLLEERFHRGYAAELLHLLRHFDYTALDALPESDAEGRQLALALIERCDVAVRTGLRLLLHEDIRADFLRRTADEEGGQSYSVDQVGWAWWGSSALKGSKLQGIELTADWSSDGALEWTVEILASRKELRRSLATHPQLPWCGDASDWSAARLGDMRSSSFSEALGRALERTAELLTATSSLIPELLLPPCSASAPDASLPSLGELASALQETALYETTGASLAMDLVRRVHDRIGPWHERRGGKRNSLWSRHGNSPRFYLDDEDGRLAGLGLWFREDKAPGRRFRAWVWSQRPEVRTAMRREAKKRGFKLKRDGNDLWLKLRVDDRDPQRQDLKGLAENLDAVLRAGAKAR